MGKTCAKQSHKHGGVIDLWSLLGQEPQETRVRLIRFPGQSTSLDLSAGPPNALSGLQRSKVDSEGIEEGRQAW